jgi:hypothetical protein
MPKTNIFQLLDIGGKMHLSFSDPLIVRYPAGDYDTLSAAAPDAAALRAALYDAREMGEIPADAAKVYLPNGRLFLIDEADPAPAFCAMGLAWGLQGVIPKTAAAAFGARAILKNGVVDIVPDRTDVFDAANGSGEWLTLLKWINGPGLKWINGQAKHLYGDSALLCALDDGRFHARMNTNASYGYLYISAWADAEL